MAATPYDVMPTTEQRSARPARLPRRIHVNLGQFGGKLGLGVIALGLLVIALGWNGMAGSGGQINHVSDLRAQLPFLLSGGFLGLSIVVLGGALLLVTSHREDRARLERKLDELIEATGRAGTAAPSAPADAAGLVVAGASSYHRPDCRLASGREDVSYLTAGEAQGRGLTACRVCRPEGAESASAGAR
jgi:hypothetical protein